MSLFDPHRTLRRYSRRTQHKGQIIQSRLTDPPVSIDNRLIPVYRDYLFQNGYFPNPLPFKLSETNFYIPGLVDIDITFEQIVTNWTHVSMTASGDFWEYSRTAQPLYSFFLGFVPLDGNLCFYVSGTIGDNTSSSGAPVGFRVPLDASAEPPLLYFTQIAVTPPTSSPYFGYWRIRVGDSVITFSDRQYYFKLDSASFPIRFYPSPQMLPRSLFDLA